MEREILFASLSLNVCLLIAVIGYRIKCKKILDEFHRLLNGQPDGKTYYPSHDPIINSTYNPKEFRAYALATPEDLEEINP